MDILTVIFLLYFIYFLRALVVMKRTYCQADGVNCGRKFGIVTLGLFELSAPTQGDFTFRYAHFAEEERE